MNENEIKEWDVTKGPNKVETITNLAWSDEFNTVGVVTGDNIYWRGKDYNQIKNLNLLDWHGLSLCHVFETKSLHVEPLVCGGVSANSVQILCPKTPLIKNWDFIEPYENPYLIDNPILLQKIIVKQDESLTKIDNERKCLLKV